MSSYSEETGLPVGQTPESKAAAAAVAAAFLEGVEPAEDAVSESDVAVPIRVPSIPPPEPEVQTEPAAETEASAEKLEPFDFDAAFNPKLSPDLESLLEDDPPDFDAEARAEVAAEQQQAEDAGEYYDGDPDSSARLKALEKRNAFLEGRLVETNRSKWVAENARAYPLLAEYAKDELNKIQATSRRGFAREAKAANDRIAAIAKPLLDSITARLAEDRDKATTEARSAVAASWGEPALDPAATGVSTAQLDAVKKARQTGDLSNVIKEMIKPSPTTSF